MKPQQEFESLARAATKCRECFVVGEVTDPYIDVAQPTWVGPKYWDSPFRVTILMINPGQTDNTPRAKTLLLQIHNFRDGEIKLRTILDKHFKGMEGRFADFYIKGLGLDWDTVAFANVAWCATKNNDYPRTMLDRCFERHTERLLEILRPNVVLGPAAKPVVSLNTRASSDLRLKSLTSFTMPIAKGTLQRKMNCVECDQS
jgi:hypothetical protein